VTKRLTQISRAITRDETTYPQADEFNPERWLSPEYPTYREPLTHYPNLAGFSQFGFGRRTCQGVPVVEQDLFLTMGGLAWAFDIRKQVDPATGKERPVHWLDYTPLLIAKPVQFPFDAVPRSEDKVHRMRQMFDNARDGPVPAGRDDGIRPMDISQFQADLGWRVYGDCATDILCDEPRRRLSVVREALEEEPFAVAVDLDQNQPPEASEEGASQRVQCAGGCYWVEPEASDFFVDVAAEWAT
jgi:hypothetical protein